MDYVYETTVADISWNISEIKEIYVSFDESAAIMFVSYSD